MAIGSDWFTNTNQYNLFKSSLERSQLNIKLAQAQRMEADLAALNQKYDGKKAAGIEEDINKIASQKFDVTKYLSSVETGLKRMDDVRTQLLMAKDAINLGSGAAFDLAVNTINLWIGRQSDSTDSVIANNGNGQGSWRQDVTVVSGAGMTVEVKHQFMGSDYAIDLGNGQVLRPDKKGEVLSGSNSGDMKLSDLTFTDNGDGTVTVHDGVNGTDYTGTLKRGGLGLMNAFAYGNLTKPDENYDPLDPDAVAQYNAQVAARARASADIDAAIKKLAQIERNLNSYEAGLSGITNGLDGKSRELSEQYKKVSEEELSAKQAERRAIETRFNIATNAMALTNETTSTFVYQMFVKSSGYEKQDLTDVLLGLVGG